MRRIGQQGRVRGRYGAYRRGFSLVELVLVIAIIGILSAMAIPRMGGSLEYQRAMAAGRRVVADINLARRHALLSGVGRTVEFDSGQAAYSIDITDPDHPTQEYRVALGSSPYEAQLRSVDLGGETEVTFDGYGAPTAGGSVVVQVGTTLVVVVVDPQTGEARLP